MPIKSSNFKIFDTFENINLHHRFSRTVSHLVQFNVI